MTRYVIVGAGAVGATVAAQLHESGRSVVLIARGEHLRRLRARGLDYIRPDGVRRLPIPVAGTPDEVELAANDVLVFATKSQDTESAVQAWAWQPVNGGPRTAAQVLPVVLLQNGLENGRVALRRFGTVIDTVVALPSSYLTPGEVVSPAAPLVGAIWLGRWPNGDQHVAREVADALADAGFATEAVDDIFARKAAKLLGNVGYNLDVLYAPSALRDQLESALRAEASGVFEANGIEPVALTTANGVDLSQVVTQSIPGHERGGSSTWQSLTRAVSVETDFLNGEIVLLARLAGVQAPLNTTVQQRIAQAAREGTPPGELGDDEVHALLASTVRPEVLVDVKELREALESDDPPVLLDVRWALGDRDGYQHYCDGHIPGAVYVDLERELAGSPTPLAGRHPLPEIADLQAAARRWGVHTGGSVVVYDAIGGLSAARAWWLLRWAGLTDVRILDGALPAWIQAGFPVATGAAGTEAGDVVLSAGHLAVLTADEAAQLAQTGVLLDARAAERYRGDVEPIDPRAGHIPGAVSAPTGDNLDSEGSFLPIERLRDQFAALGADGSRPVGVYCGSAVTAAHEIAALAAVGIAAALYPGSWSAWSADPDRPVATGSVVTTGESP